MLRAPPSTTHVYAPSFPVSFLPLYFNSNTEPLARHLAWQCTLLGWMQLALQGREH